MGIKEKNKFRMISRRASCAGKKLHPFQALDGLAGAGFKLIFSQTSKLAQPWLVFPGTFFPASLHMYYGFRLH
jgi:hypothetical protein